MENQERLSRIEKVLFTVIGTIIFLALLEFGADFLTLVYRIYGKYNKPPKTESTSKVRWEKDDYLRGRFVPSQRSVLLNNLPVSINSYGFRGRELSKKSVRIICMGDSVTFGWSASSDEKTYPYILEKLLSSFDVEVVNAGMPRWNTMNLLSLYITRVIPLKPDIVIMLMGWNDIGHEFAPRLEITESDSDKLRSVLSITYDTYNTARLINRLLNRIKSKRVSNPDTAIKAREVAKDPIKWERLDEYERIVRTFAFLVKANSSTPVLVTLPHFMKPSLSENEKRTLLPHLLGWPDLSYQGWRQMVTEVNQRVRRVSSDLNIPLVDCEYRISYQYFTDMAHLNDEGDELLAKCVAEKIEVILSDNFKKSSDQRFD